MRRQVCRRIHGRVNAIAIEFWQWAEILLNRISGYPAKVVHTICAGLHQVHF
jgi:hypothetical protein